MRPADVRRDRCPRVPRRASAIASAAGAFALAALVPKCPLCIAAALSAWGVGTSMAGTLAPSVRPVLFAVAVLLAVQVKRGRARSHEAALRQRCCSA
mgnify:CR=1 FL=1